MSYILYYVNVSRGNSLFPPSFQITPMFHVKHFLTQDSEISYDLFSSLLMFHVKH
jgi:hypothetical protein